MYPSASPPHSVSVLKGPSLSATPTALTPICSDSTTAIHLCLQGSASHVLYLSQPVLPHALLKQGSSGHSACKQSQEFLNFKNFLLLSTSCSGHTKHLEHTCSELVTNHCITQLAMSCHPMLDRHLKDLAGKKHTTSFSGDHQRRTWSL